MNNNKPTQDGPVITEIMTGEDKAKIRSARVRQIMAEEGILYIPKVPERSLKSKVDDTFKMIGDGAKKLDEATYAMSREYDKMGRNLDKFSKGVADADPTRAKKKGEESNSVVKSIWEN